MRKIKKGDEVIIITGKNKNQRGKVLRVVKDGKKAVVEGINLIKKHTKPNPNTNTQGGIVEKEAPISISNIAIYNPVSKKRDRAGVKVLDNGKRARYFKSNKELIEI
ncbi:MAG: 50S ribosomal protein L24 [Gammaproteobacteria bacterium]|nr:50S ribosomal protein L24 [Gammaproteobacteria bacterium]